MAQRWLRVPTRLWGERSGRPMLRGLVKPPREPSALGIILYSGLLGVLTASDTTPLGAAMALLALGLHILTFDAGFDAAKTRNTRLLAAILALNSAPYLVVLAAYRDTELAAAVAVYVPVMLLYLYLALRGLLRTPPGYIAGAALLTYTAVLTAALAGRITRETILAFTLMMLYTASTAAYIESRLPFRRTSPATGLAIWLPALATAATNPALAVALAEPTIKHVANTARNTKIKPSEIKKLGWQEMIRLTVFAALLAALLRLTASS